MVLSHSHPFRTATSFQVQRCRTESSSYTILMARSIPPTLSHLLHSGHPMDFGGTSTPRQTTLNTTDAIVTCWWYPAIRTATVQTLKRIYIMHNHHVCTSPTPFQPLSHRILVSMAVLSCQCLVLVAHHTMVAEQRTTLAMHRKRYVTHSER